jgi:hypothetical protein
VLRPGQRTAYYCVVLVRVVTIIGLMALMRVNSFI